MKKKMICLLAAAASLVLCFSGCKGEPAEKPYDSGDADKIIREPNFDIEKATAGDGSVFKLPTLLTRNAVLQRDRVLKIWGECSVDGPVAVRINGKDHFGLVKDGAFEVYIEPLPGGGPYEMTVLNAANRIVVGNILAGDVYICAGQSNMEMLVGACDYGEVVAASENPNLRLLVMPREGVLAPVKDKRVAWVDAKPGTVNSFSAAGYFFGKTLQEKYRVPVGLIMAAVGDTSVRPWAPQEEADAMPKVYYDPTNVNRMSATYFNGMVYPLKNMKAKGVLWYQGENQPEFYDEMLASLISGWRRVFNQNLPFIVIQLPRFYLGDDAAWYTSREMQKRACELAGNAYYSVNIDCGVVSNDLNTAIHPADKRPVGERAAYTAMKYLYGEKGVLSGPVYAGYSVKGNALTLNFSDIGSGLELKNGGRGFEIRNEAGVYVPASAQLIGGKVVITAQVGSVTGFRYAYGAFPEVSLYNGEGFPAEQFLIEL